MALTTQTVTGTIYYSDGSPMDGAIVSFTLNGTASSVTDPGTVPPNLVNATCNASGEFTTNLWPNSLGVGATNYTVAVTYTDSTSGKSLQKILGKVSVPSEGTSYTLSDLLVSGVVAPTAVYLGVITQAQYDEITTLASDLGDISDAVASTEADAAQTALDRVAVDAAVVEAQSARDATIASALETWPTTAAGIGNGIAGVTSIVGGSGGTDGTFALSFSGGTNLVAPRGRFIVAGGVVTEVIIDYPGYYSAGTPTVSFAASSGLTGASAVAVMGPNTPVGGYFSIPGSADFEFSEQFRVDVGPVAVSTGFLPSRAAVTATQSYADRDIEAADLLPAFGKHLTQAEAATTSIGINRTVAFMTPTASTITIRSVSIVAKALGSFQLRAYTLSGGDLNYERTLATITVRKVGLNHFSTEHFTALNLLAGEYLAVTPLTSGLLGYYGESTDDQLYYDPGAPDLLPFPASGTSKLLLSFAAYTESAQDRVSAENATISEAVDRVEDLTGALTVTQDYRAGVKGALTTGSNAASGTLITAVPIPRFGKIVSLDIVSTVASTVTVGVYTKVGTYFTRIRSAEVAVTSGTINVPVSLPVRPGEYVGIGYPTGAVKFAGVSAGYDGAYYIGQRSRELNITTPINVANGFQFAINTELQYPAADADNALPWEGETLVTFGDSITWYNGRTFNPGQAEEGDVVVGYQSYIADKLGCSIDNEGLSGKTMPEIYTNAVLPMDFTSTFAVTLTSGANDHRKAVSPGTVLPLGSTFDTATYAGAMQAAIEHILGDSPVVKIYLITPIRGYYFESGTADVPGPYNGEMEISRDYVDIIKAIGKVYGLPVIDWYDSTEINDLTYRYWLGDDEITVPYALHPRNRGFERMGKVAAEQMWLYK